MNITLAEFAIATAVGIAAGWLWCSDDAHALDPITGRVDTALRWLIRNGVLTKPVWRYLDDMQSCPICLGFWVQLAAVAAISGWSAWTIPVALSALVAHLGWQLITGALTAVILR